MLWIRPIHFTVTAQNFGWVSCYCPVQSGFCENLMNNYHCAFVPSVSWGYILLPFSTRLWPIFSFIQTGASIKMPHGSERELGHMICVRNDIRCIFLPWFILQRQHATVQNIWNYSGFVSPFYTLIFLDIFNKELQRCYRKHRISPTVGVQLTIYYRRQLFD